MASRSILSLTPAKAMLLVVLLGWLAYANSFTKAFHLDDNLWIVANDDLPSWRLNVLRHIQRPVVALSLTANWALGGFHPAGYHFVNLAIHLGAALALFGLVRRTLLLPRWRGAFDDSALGLAFAIAALWVVHPLNTHSVTYIIQRCESAMGLCYVFSLYALLRGTQTPRPVFWYAPMVAAAWIGVGCKEVMVTIIPVALLFDRVFLAESWLEIVRRRGFVYLVLASILLLPLWSHLQSLLMSDENDGASAGFAIPNLDPKTYFLTELTVLPYYLRLAFWPVGLCFDYRDWQPPSSPLEYVPGGIGLTVLFLACGYGLTRRNGFAFLGMAAFLVLSLTSSFLPLLDVANEYRMYVPLMAIVAASVIGGYLVIVHLWPSFALRPLAQAAVLVPLVAVLVVLTSQRNEDYRTPLSLWEDVLAKRPTNYKVYHHLAAAYESEAKWDEAKENHLLCLEHLPGHFFSLANLGMIHYRAGETAQGIRYLKKAVRLYDTHADTTTLLATFLHLEGTSDQAIALLDHAKRLDPYKALPRFHRAGVLLDTGRAEAAAAEFDQAAFLFPTWPEKFQKFARARLRGRFGDSPGVRREALFYARIADAASPRKSIDNLTTLADAYVWNGRYADALVPLREAIDLAPAEPPAPRRDLEEKLRVLKTKIN
jgi:tetratricopeptide (TPR) repeat protein